MKHYTRGQFTATFFPADGIPPTASPPPPSPPCSHNSSPAQSSTTQALTSTGRSRGRAASSSTTANPPRRTTDMGRFKAHTTHTVKLSWDPADPLDKSDLIRGLSDVLPDGAAITELTVGDCPNPQAEIAGPKATRTLTITYLENPVLARYRRP